MSAITYIDAIREGMREELLRDENVYCLGEDIGTYGGAFRATKGFLQEFGRPRILDTPLSESAILGAAIGFTVNPLGGKLIAGVGVLSALAWYFLAEPPGSKGGGDPSAINFGN